MAENVPSIARPVNQRLPTPFALPSEPILQFRWPYALKLRGFFPEVPGALIHYHFGDDYTEIRKMMGKVRYIFEVLDAKGMTHKYVRVHAQKDIRIVRSAWISVPVGFALRSVVRTAQDWLADLRSSSAKSRGTKGVGSLILASLGVHEGVTMTLPPNATSFAIGSRPFRKHRPSRRPVEHVVHQPAHSLSWLPRHGRKRTAHRPTRQSKTPDPFSPTPFPFPF